MWVSASSLDLLERNHQHFSTINEGSWSKTQIHVAPRACRKNDEAKTEGDDEVLVCLSYRLDLLLCIAAGLYTWNGLRSPRCWPACEESAIDLQFADCMPTCRTKSIKSRSKLWFGVHGLKDFYGTVHCRSLMTCVANNYCQVLIFWSTINLFPEDSIGIIFRYSMAESINLSAKVLLTLPNHRRIAMKKLVRIVV